MDYKTLLFFIGLFVVGGGLEKTGILTLLAGFIGNVSGGNLKVMIAIIIWVSAVASAFIDNIPFAATMIPVISSLSAAQGVDISILAWALAMGTDIGGSATPIGTSANVVGIATAAKSGHMIKWGNKLLYRSVKGMNSSPADNVAEMQFSFIRDKAESGQSFVIVSRCSETVLKEFAGFISVFVIGDMKDKVARV